MTEKGGVEEQSSRRRLADDAVLAAVALAIVIGIGELLTTGQNLYEGGQSTAALEIFLVVSLVYFVLTFATNRSLDRLSNYYAVPEGTT